MNQNFRYIFNKGSKKWLCPNCGKKKFVRYYDNLTQSLADPKYGRCDREEKCGYFNTPSEGKDEIPYIPPPIVKRETVYIPNDVLDLTIDKDRLKHNNFLNNLFDFFDRELVLEVANMYKLGTITSGYMKGGLSIPFIDRLNRVRAIQLKTFDKDNHTIHTNFIHSYIKKNLESANKEAPEWITEYTQNDLLVSCFFGEHLLDKYPNNPVAIVEAPKTAVYATIYYGIPKTDKDTIWLSSFNISSLTLSRCKVLSGRNVTLYPDVSIDGKTFDRWKAKAKELSKKVARSTFSMYSKLEEIATDKQREKGYDLADFIFEHVRKYR